MLAAEKGRRTLPEWQDRAAEMAESRPIAYPIRATSPVTGRLT